MDRTRMAFTASWSRGVAGVGMDGHSNPTEETREGGGPQLNLARLRIVRTVMRFALAALLLVHGLIHLMGFAKAFGFAALGELKAPVSKPSGALWLFAAVSLVSAAGALALHAEAWFWIAAPALVISQVLVCRSWSDAKFGTIANILILLPVLVAWGQNREGGLRRSYARAIERSEARALPSADVLTEKDLAGLPGVVQQYLRVTRSVGRPRISRYQMEFAGAFRQKPDGSWLDVHVRQTSFARPTLRAFLIESRLYGVPFDGLHLFEGPHATMQIRVAGLVRVVDARGPNMDQAETVTLLNDMCLMAPSTLVDAAL